MGKEPSLTLTVRVPVSLLDKARVRSQETGISISFVVRKALEKWTAEKGIAGE